MNLIRDYRKAAGMTQAELAMMTGCRRETIANLEKDRYNPSLTLADKIAQALECSIYQIFPLLDSAECERKETDKEIARVHAMYHEEAWRTFAELSK